jgi:uncharacterized membrane protein YhaH (DUF805 family)
MPQGTANFGIGTLEGMPPFALFLSPSGRLSATPFLIGVFAAFAFGCLSLMALSSRLPASFAILLFAVAQGMIVWCWFCLHVKRLRDAGLPVTPATAIALLYCLAMCLLLLVLVSMPLESDDMVGGNELLAMLAGFASDPEPGLFGYVAMGILLLVLLPVVIALGFSFWLARQISVKEQASPSP